MRYWPQKYGVIVGFFLVGFFVTLILNLLVKLQEILYLSILCYDELLK